ncbi:MAG: VacJ family lipoprotein [bacterium]
MSPLLQRAVTLLVVTVALALAGCGAQKRPHPDDDPWEGMNRKVFWLNDNLDSYGLEPVARGWNYIMPNVAQRGLSNFFDNLRLPIVLVNDILQAQPRLAAETVARFQCNTFLGGLGFYDLASDLGVPPHVQDTGLTFGRWGIEPGPYVMLPFFGPSNPRDTVGFAIDGLLAIYPFFINIPGITVGASAIDLINRRSRVLDQVNDAKQASIDYYSFIRNAYVQRRWKEVRGQAPPGGAEEEDLYNEENFEGYLEEGEQP